MCLSRKCKGCTALCKIYACIFTGKCCECHQLQGKVVGSLVQAVGDDLIDSVVSDSIPILTEQEKFNEAVSSIVKRVEAKLTGGEH